MNPILQSMYDILPARLQSVVLSGFSRHLARQRYSKRYREYQGFLETSQWWSESKLKAWQDSRLRQLIEHAYRTVPLYRQRFDERGIKPEHIQSQSDLPLIPVLTRSDIVSHIDDLVSTDTNRAKLVGGHTSGTTGSPLQVLYDEDTIAITYAMLDRQYRWAGSSLDAHKEVVGVLRGNVIVPLSQKHPPFWRMNGFEKQLLLSAFHMSDVNLDSYVRALKTHAVSILDGYPSTLYLLARFLLHRGDTLPMSFVITGSETLFDFQREAITAAFACPVFDYLAAAERVVFTVECDKHEGHHLCSEYGITEFLDTDGHTVEDGENGTMICTSLFNFGMPLIRYATRDVCALKEHRCSCGRELPLVEDVTTKAEDIIRLADGRMISPSVLTHPFKPMHNVEASQVVQTAPDSLEIRVVPKPSYSQADADHLVREFKHRLGEDVDIRITLVGELERTRNGKFKWVISNVTGAVSMPEQATRKHSN